MTYRYPKHYDVLVVGAGHAGIEAALAAQRVGSSVALLTQNLDTVAQMSCNPAIGGLAKGHLVREIDALGGFMGRNTDSTGIQFRMLNASKGPSVRAPRAQCDKKAYQFRAKWFLENTDGIALFQGNATELVVSGDVVCGVRTNLGVEYSASAVVITTGTFMRGLMHVGDRTQSGGRMGDAVSTLSEALIALGFDVRRLKTGTPCRLHGGTIDYGKCQRQNGDDSPQMFSHWNEMNFSGEPKQQGPQPFSLNDCKDGLFHVEQIPCWITYTTESTHEIIRGNLHRSALYSGKIEGTGPRYCPSIEDKVVRFADKDRHQIFLEPEGHQTREVYVNGVSTSLPFDVQHQFIQSIPGLEKAEILRAGYAVEYDYCPSTQLRVTLETKRIENLFFAGQINGTSGYEEAAGQGLVAGVNAANKIQGRPPFVVERSEGYIGVLIDDLITKDIFEPYRMFTSRAEHRLLLRQDNADLRLAEKGFEHRLISREQIDLVRKKQEAIDDLHKFTTMTSVDGVRINVLLRRPGFEWRQLEATFKNKWAPAIWDQVQINIRYEGYINRELMMIERLKRLEQVQIDSDMNYGFISGLRKEAIEKLSQVKPETLRQASRLAGVTPADISVLAVYLERAKAKLTCG